MMSKIDFTKQGYIGCPVWDPCFGNGEIAKFDLGDNCPLGIRFETADFIRWYYNDGRYVEDGLPTLCFGHREPLDQGTPPERPPKPLEFKGRPVWAYVSDNKNGWKNKRKRRVVAATNAGSFVACDQKTTEVGCSGVSVWVFAWEIPEDE